MRTIVIDDNCYRQQHCYSQRQRAVADNAIFRAMGKVSDKLYLAQWRRAKRLSQEELAHEIGYSRSTVAAAETRNYNATLSFLVAYAEGVGAPSVGALFMHPDTMDADAHELASIFAELRKSGDRATLLQVAKSLSAKSDSQPEAERE